VAAGNTGLAELKEREMADKKLEPIMLSDVKRLVVNDGVTIVLLYDGAITAEQYEALKESWNSLWKERNVKAFLLERGMDIGVLGKTT
jgi:hypothetical protein